MVWSVSHDQNTPAQAGAVPLTRPKGVRQAVSSGRMRHMSPRLALAVGAPLLLLLALAWPLLFSNSTFNEDWMNHLWYVWHQSLTIRADHLPSLFINYSHGIFYPVYAFYGGTLYALAGGLSSCSRSATLRCSAYLLTYLLGFDRRLRRLALAGAHVRPALLARSRPGDRVCHLRVVSDARLRDR